MELDPSGNLLLKERAPHPPLAGYLELNSKTTHGHTSRGIPLYLFVPLNTAYPSFIVASKETDRSQKRIAVVEFLEWTGHLPRGAIKHLLGAAGTLEAEEEALLWNACPYKNLTDGLAVLDDDAPQRRLIEGATFNIDPEGCRDVDDCITIVEDAKGVTLTITISDVASCIEELGAVDIMAAAQGQTLYRDGYAVRPMLPPFFSEDHCSLLAGTERRGISLAIRIEDGKVVGEEWFESTLHNNETYTYDLFLSSSHASSVQRCAAVLVNSESDDPHVWIETFMKYYNLAAAKLLLAAGTGILRTHSEPDLARIEKYKAMDPALGTLATSAASYTLIGTQSSYAHWGVEAAAYCHATSPIRRYADLANQRILKQLIRSKPEGLFVSVPVSDLNMRAKISKGYERDRAFLHAVLDGSREFEARILDQVEEGDRMKLTLWVPAWQQRIKYRCKRLGEQIVSADETVTRTVVEGQILRFRCGVNLGARRWKDRLVIEFV